MGSAGGSIGLGADALRSVKRNPQASNDSGPFFTNAGVSSARESPRHHHHHPPCPRFSSMTVERHLPCPAAFQELAVGGVHPTLLLPYQLAGIGVDPSFPTTYSLSFSIEPCTLPSQLQQYPFSTRSTAVPDDYHQNVPDSPYRLNTFTSFPSQLPFSTTYTY